VLQTLTLSYFSPKEEFGIETLKEKVVASCFSDKETVLNSLESAETRLEQLKTIQLLAVGLCPTTEEEAQETASMVETQAITILADELSRFDENAFFERCCTLGDNVTDGGFARVLRAKLETFINTWSLILTEIPKNRG